MARPSSSSVALMLLVAAPLIGLHLLLLPPLVSSAAVRPPLLGKITIRGKEVLKDLMKKVLKDIQKEALEDQKRGSAPVPTPSSRFFYSQAFDDSDGSHTVIHLGGDAVPLTKRSRSTPLLRSNMYPALYYVRLIGIQVDGQALNDIPAGTFELQANGSGGVFLSTTMPVTFLEEAAYKVVRRAFESRIRLPTVNGSALGLDLCFTMQSMVGVAVPNLTLLFDGKDAAMELKTENYFFTDNTTGLECLTILPSQGWSLLGSLLQRGKTMIYDLQGKQLTFETAREVMQTAGAPPPPPVQVSLMIIAPFLALVLLF